LGLQGRVNLDRGGPDEWLAEVEPWREAGAAHLTACAAADRGNEETLEILRGAFPLVSTL
jgi:hypothetical protein